jgi:hypothetical protein
MTGVVQLISNGLDFAAFLHYFDVLADKGFVSHTLTHNI